MATTNEAVTAPLEIEQVAETTGAPCTEQVVSLGEKPDPAILTVDLTGPETGLSAIDGGLTLDVVV